MVYPLTLISGRRYLDLLLFRFTCILKFHQRTSHRCQARWLWCDDCRVAPIAEETVPITYEEGSSISSLRLEAEVGIRDALELKRILLDALAGEKELRVNVANATELDITVFQLLRAAALQAQAANLRIYLEGNVAESVSAAYGDAGLPNFPLDVEPSH